MSKTRASSAANSCSARWAVQSGKLALPDPSPLRNPSRIWLACTHPIQLPAGPTFEGIGGGGKVKIVPFEVEELSLGAVKKRRVRAFFGPFPDRIEYSEGFRIGGIISHQFFRPYALTFDFTRMRLFLKEERR